MNDLSLSMSLLNQGRPFVSGRFAERLALLVIEEKYSEQFFKARGSATVVDKGETWSVTVENGLIDPQDKRELPFVGGELVPRRLTISIRKVNAEILSIT
jgi:hypothetical protein